MKRNLGKIWIKFLYSKYIFKKKTRLDLSKIKSVLIIELSRMGDVVSMFNAINCMMANLRDTTFGFVVNSRYNIIIKKMIEKFEIDFKKVYIHSLPDTETISGLHDAKKILEGYSYDLICSMSPTLKNSYLALSLKSLYRAGFFQSNSHYTPFLYNTWVKTTGIKDSHKISYTKENIEERGMKLCDVLGLDRRKSLSKKIPLNKQSNNKYILIHPFSGWRYRAWNINNFIELAKSILIDYDNIDVIFVGSIEEAKQAEYISSKIKDKRIKFLFKEEFDDFINLLPDALLFIGNDSGPLHLASFFEVPVVGLYGPAPPELTAPQKSNNYYFYKKVKCSPCKQIKCIYPSSPCIDLITMEEVKNKVFELLKYRYNSKI